MIAAIPAASRSGPELHAGRVEERDHHDREDVVHDRQGEHERFQARGRAARGERQDPQGERDVGGHGDPPPAGAVAPRR